METFIILTQNLTNGFYCENIALYYIQPNSKILAKRISPFFIYSEQYGYIKAFDQMKMMPLCVEESAFNDYLFKVKIIDKNGCHTTFNPHPIFMYYYTLTCNTVTEILEKKDLYYKLSDGGWTTKTFDQVYPTQKKKVLFKFLIIKKPIVVIVSNLLGTVWKKDNETKFLTKGTFCEIVKKGFDGDTKVLYCADGGYIPYSDTSLIGYYALENNQTTLSNKCIICTKSSIDCSYIHGDFSHSFCCYECSKKILSAHCPICRLPVEKVVLNYTQSFPTTEKD